MTISIPDTNGRATNLAAEAEYALGIGDTALAKQKFAEAGAILEEQVRRVRKQADKHLARFLAASQYYKGGHYHKALALSQKIQADLLPANVRPIFARFLHDARVRASPSYLTQTRHQLGDLWQRKQGQRLLELLQQHPYVLEPSALAFVRAGVCEEFGNYRVAALMWAEAVRLAPSKGEVLAAPAAMLLRLAREGKLDEAWGYMQHLLDVLPSAATHLTASLLYLHRAAARPGDDGVDPTKEQLRHFDLGWEEFQTLPPADRSADLKWLAALALDAAATSCLRLDNAGRALELCNIGIELNPNAPDPWTTRGVATYPEQNAVADFQKALALGESSYFPHYYLAHHAIAQGEYKAALAHIQRVLEGRSSPAIRSQMYGWLAVCRAKLDAPRQEVEALFRQALAQHEPPDATAAANYQRFLKQTELEHPGPAEAALRGKAQKQAEEDVVDGERQFAEVGKREALIARQLQPA